MAKQPQAWILPLLGCVLLVALVCPRTMPGFRALMANDSFQYLSVAANIDHGAGLRTSIAHFDEERSWGVLPAPITTFPVGYPLVVAALAASGLNAETAALLVSLSAACWVVVLLDMLARRLGLALFWRALLMGFVVANEITLRTSSYAVSEPLFTALMLAAMVLLVTGLQRQELQQRWIVPAAAAGLVLGLADWVRYAGLFPFVGVLAAGCLALAVRRRDAARPLLLAAMVALVPIAAQMLRNVLLVGSWRGGNNKVVSRAPLRVAHLFGHSVRDLVIGNAPWSHLLIPRVMLALLVVGCGAVALCRLVCVRPRVDGIRKWPIQSADALVVVVVATYVASILYVASCTMISLEARILYPIYPLALLLVAKLAQRADDRPWLRSAPGLWRLLCVTTLLLSAGLHVDAYFSTPIETSYLAAIKELNSTTSDGIAARHVIRELTGTDGVLMATNGQALGYLTGVPTVSLVEPEFSSHRWDESYVRDTVRQFSVAALVVRRDTDHMESEDFLGQLGAAHAPPWLMLSGITSDVAVYRPILPK